MEINITMKKSTLSADIRALTKSKESNEVIMMNLFDDGHSVLLAEEKDVEKYLKKGYVLFGSDAHKLKKGTLFKR